MAAYGWGTNRPLEDWLFDEGYRFDFFQAVRLVGMRRPPFARTPVRPDTSNEVVRFRSTIDMSFPVTDVARVTRPDKPNGTPEITVNLLGLAGALGPLPRPFSYLVYDRTRHGDTAMRDFLDIFNHRIAMLMYQGREYRRIGFEVGVPSSHRTARYLASLIGLGVSELRDRLPIPDDGVMRYSGILARRPTSITGLETVIAGIFGLRVSSKCLQGAWHQLDEDQQTQIGRNGSNQLLGRGAVLGSKVWDQQSEFEMILGPMSWAHFVDLLPGGKGFISLCGVTRYVVGSLTKFKLTLKILARDVPKLRIGQGHGSRLGYNTWLGSRPGSGNEERSMTISSRLTRRAPGEGA